MYVALRRLMEMLLVTTPCVVVLSICTGVGSFLCPISPRACWEVKASFKLIKREASLSSASENMKALMIWVMVMTALLLGGVEVLLDMKKVPPARIRNFDS